MVSCARLKELTTLDQNFDPKIIQELGIRQSYGVVDTYQHIAPVIDMEEFMFQLTSFLSKHPMCSLDTTYGSIDQDLLEVEDTLRKAYKVDAIVNCLGLGFCQGRAGELFLTMEPGLRQARIENIRLGRETRLTKDGNPSAIVHTYGHGGGFAPFGCAENLVAIAKSIL
ncbi:hypothetical protein SELMODRAFT_426739 [Selaginella moellendorffii]|uniref:Uncharacterized protein n=1 Tax=Selaginella moellendorffii TaxID=88036 RepID=D8SXB7_SELML|nr:hypothetical protein SELMODRAFT_426739 [Selaginella moellendorffii]